MPYLGLLHRKQREIAVAEALKLSAFYIALALVFNAGVFYVSGAQKGLEFLTGYLIEKSLSLDNIFAIALIFGHFAVPPQYQHRVLFWGILGALAMRAALIFAGTALIMEFRWIVYVFGTFLILTCRRRRGGRRPRPTTTSVTAPPRSSPRSTCWTAR